MERTNEIEAASEEILNRLVAQYQTPLRRMCFVILRDEELAKDAVQDTFFKAYKNIAAFRRECSEKNMADENRNQHLSGCQALSMVPPFGSSRYAGGSACADCSNVRRIR